MPKSVNKFRRLWCCNPFQLGKHNKVGKRKVTEEMQKKISHLVPGEVVCHACRLKISKMDRAYRSDDTETETEVKISSGEEFIPSGTEEETKLSNLNKLLTPLGQSPVSKRKLSRVKSYAQRKANVVNESINEILNVTRSSNDGEEIILQFKEKFQAVKSANEKYMILTCLPKSWTEHKIMSEFGVSVHVARTAKLTQDQKGIMSIPDRKYQRHLPQEIQDLIISFFEEDDICRVMPGMKDTKTVKECGRRVKKQKRLVLANLRELYKEFKIRHPNCKVGFSSFASLRPKHCVLPGAAGTHNVCVCSICENTKLMLNSLYTIIQDGNSEMNSLDYYVHKMMCDNASSDCFLNKCYKCPGPQNVSEFVKYLLDDNLVEELVYKKWKTTDRAEIITVRASAEIFTNNFVINLKKFKSHKFIVKAQSAYLKHLKNYISPGEFIVIGDYSENYSFITQDAIQGCHWSTSQATIHPFVIYYRNVDNTLEHICFSVISDCLVHDTAGVHLFQKKLITNLKDKFSEIKKIYYFSDGAAGQYKNKKNFMNLLHHKTDFQVTAEWHFFATSHGKGPCDGVGGTIKRLAAYASLQGTQISNPTELYDWARSNITGISFSFTSKKEHEEESRVLNSERFVSLKTVPGTRCIHSVVPLSENKLSVKMYSGSPEVPREVALLSAPRSRRGESV